MAQLQTTAVTGSLTVTGEITAQTLNVQQVTSSIVYSSGSNRFGSLTSDVQQFTGSLRVTGSGNHYIIGGNVGIDTLSPTYKLQVNGTGNGLYVIGASVTPFSQTIATFVYGGNGNSINIENQGGKASIQARVGASTMDLILNNAGSNVGIGTSAPAAKLHSIGSGIVNIVQSSDTVSYTQYYNTSTGTNSTNDGLTVGLNGTSAYVFNREAAPLILGTSGLERGRFTAGGTFLVGDTATPGETAWFGTGVFGKNATNKVILGYLASSTNGAVIAGHNSALNAWAELNINGTNIIFRSNESETMRLTSTGNLGIGTTAPGAKLHVASGEIWVFGQTNSRILLGDSASSGQWGGLRWDTTTDSLQIIHSSVNSGNSGVINILSNGNVGINTTAPTAELQISGSSDVLNVKGSGSLATSSLFSVDGAYGRLFEVSDDLSNSLFSVNTIAGLPVIEAFADYSVNLGTYSAASGSTMRITGSRVGINTTSPEATLDVLGNIRAQSFTGSFSGSSAAPGANNNVIYNSSGILAGSNNFIFDGTNVGIGTTSPNTKLHVSGTIGGVFEVDGRLGVNALYVSASGNVGLGTTAPISRLQLGSSWTANPGGGNQVYLSSTGFANSNIVPEVIITSNNASTSPGGMIGLALHNDNATPGAFSPLLVFSKTETGSSPYNASIAAIGARTVTGTGAGGAWIDGDLMFYTAPTAGSGLVERMRIIQDGNVGIGTTTPSAKLAVRGGSITVGATDTQVALLGADGSNVGYVGTTTNTPFAIRTNGSNNRVWVTETGDVGINTTAPAQKLHISTGTNYQGILINGNNAPSIGFVKSTTTTPEWKVGISGTNGASFAISTGASNNDLLFISSSGNIGIGTTTPAANLDVYNATQSSIYNRVGAAGANWLTTSTQSQFGTYSNIPLQIKTNDIARIYITNSGNVLIGSTSDSGEKLQVTGTMKVTGASSFGGNMTLSLNQNARTQLEIRNTTNGASADACIVIGSTVAELKILKLSPSSTAYKTLASNDAVIYNSTQNGDISILNDFASGNIKFAAGGSSTAQMVLKSTSQLQLNQYGTGAFSGTVAYNLAVDTNGNIIETAGGVVDGSGTANYISKWQDANTLTNSVIVEGTRSLGVNTATPVDFGAGTYNLNIYDAGIPLIQLANSTTGQSTSAGMRIQANSNDFLFLNNQATGNILLYTSGSERMRITATGNVGINTSSPTNRLQIGNLTSTSTATPETLSLGGTYSNSAGSNIKFRVYDAGTTMGGMSVSSGQIEVNTWSTGKLAFYRGTTQTMVIDASSNVGIGTTAPGYKLDVNGTTRIDGGNTLFTVNNDAVEVSGGYFFASQTTGVSFYAYQSVFRGLIKSDSSGGNTLRLGDTAEVLTITGSNVGIGTTSPNAKLHVSGTIGGVFEVDGRLGVNALYVSASGNVGLGTTNPSTAKLVIGGTAGQEGLDLATSDQYANLRVIRNSLNGSDKDMYIGYQSGGGSKLHLYSNNLETITVSGGSVGIGTTAPATKLDVQGDGVKLRLSTATNPTTYNFEIESRYDSANTINFYGTGGNNFLKYIYNTAALCLQPSAGSVGIGTTVPTSKLHVAGTGLFTGTDDQILTLNATDSSWSYIGYSWAGSRRFYAGLDNGGRFALGSDTGAAFYFTGGNVGIGTTTVNLDLHVVKNSNTSIGFRAENPNTGADAFSVLQLGSNVGSSLFANLSYGGSGVSVNGAFHPSGVTLANYGNGGVNFLGAGTTSPIRFFTGTGTGTLKMLINNGGNVSIGNTNNTYALDVTGTIRATGDVIAFSDVRVKENIKTVEKAIDTVKQLRGVTYTRKDIDDKSEKVGVIAQEVLEVLPQVVQQDDNGNYSVAYGNMVGLLIEAIKEQQKEIDELKHILSQK